MLKRFLMGAILSVLTALGVTAAVAQPAGASTPGCTHGAYAGYCGTMTDQETTPMSWDVFRQAARVGQPLIAFPNSASDPGVDFVILQPGTSSDGNAKMFIYAPDGHTTNLCISEPDPGAALVLRGCNASPWQTFTAKQVDGTKFYEWVNAATGDVVSADGTRSPLTGIKPHRSPALASSGRSPPDRTALPGAPAWPRPEALSRSRPGDPRA